MRADLAWQRPTWPLGRLGTAAWEEKSRGDPLDLFADGRFNQRRGRVQKKAPVELRDALQTLGLTWPTTVEAVKARYKELAKRHHPDANGGRRDAEDRLKTINLAYATLRRLLVSEPQTA